MKRMYLNLFALCAFLWCVTSHISCVQSDYDEVLVEESEVIPEDNDLAILTMMGFDVSDVQDMGDYYLVEGDIVIDKEELLLYARESTTRQARWEYLVSSSKAPQIKVAIHSSVESGWREAILEALNEWSSVGSNIYMTYTTGTNYDILFQTGILPAGTVAQASWPSAAGNPGPSVTISPTFNSYTASQKKFVMVHELGHCVGLRHTDWKGWGESSGISIPGTPTGNNPDPSSIMNAGTGGTSWGGFSHYDKVAIRTLYPIRASGSTTLCPGERGTFTLSNIPFGASVYWTSDRGLLPTSSESEVYTPTNHNPEREGEIRVMGNITLADGEILRIIINPYLFHPTQTAAVIQRSSANDFYIKDVKGGQYKAHRWTSSYGIAHVQNYDWTYFEFHGQSNDGYIDITCEFTNGCGNRVSVTQYFPANIW